MSEPRSCPLDEHGAVFKESDLTLTMPSAPGDWGRGVVSVHSACSVCPWPGMVNTEVTVGCVNALLHHAGP